MTKTNIMDYDANEARIRKMLDEVNVDSSFTEDEMENILQSDSEGEEDNVEVNEYYPESDPEDSDAVESETDDCFEFKYGEYIVYNFFKSDQSGIKEFNCVS